MILDLSVLDCLIPVLMKYEPVSESIAPSGGDDTDQIGIVELLASFASLKFPIELVLKINLKVFTTPGYYTRILHQVPHQLLHPVMYWTGLEKTCRLEGKK